MTTAGEALKMKQTHLADNDVRTFKDMTKIIRDVPDIRFRLAGYPAIFSNPVPAKMVPGTGYLSRIVLSPFCTFRASLQHCRRSHY